MALCLAFTELHHYLRDSYSELIKVLQTEMQQIVLNAERMPQVRWMYLCDILKQRMREGVLIRLIGTWMNA